MANLSEYNALTLSNLNQQKEQGTEMKWRSSRNQQ